jgi:quercetin dioxygenase-like cupin family protein
MTDVRNDLGHLLVHTAAEIAAMPWQPIGTDGVAHKVLWQSGDVVIGLISVVAGASKPEHVHLGAHHHIYLTRGSCDMVGRTVDAGSYVYIPPGVPHAVDNVGPDGCEFLYTYRPLEQPLGTTEEEWGNPV